MNTAAPISLSDWQLFCDCINHLALGEAKMSALLFKPAAVIPVTIPWGNDSQLSFDAEVKDVSIENGIWDQDHFKRDPEITVRLCSCGPSTQGPLTTDELAAAVVLKPAAEEPSRDWLFILGSAVIAVMAIYQDWQSFAAQAAELGWILAWPARAWWGWLSNAAPEDRAVILLQSSFLIVGTIGAAVTVIDHFRVHRGSISWLGDDAPGPMIQLAAIVTLFAPAVLPLAIIAAIVYGIDLLSRWTAKNLQPAEK